MSLTILSFAETTARTLDAALGFLALYQDVQKEVFDEIQAVYAEDNSLVSLSYSVAVNFRSQ